MMANTASRPTQRQPSSTLCPRATSDARVAARELNSTATQNRPAAAFVSTPRSGSRAKANRTSTSTAKGATWLVVTREWPSMRRSLVATRPASRHMFGLRLRRADGGGRPGVAHDPAAGDGDGPGGEGAGPLVLV